MPNIINESESSRCKDRARDAEQSVVKSWYEDKTNVDEMQHWNVGKLKRWELDVAARFPQGARILDIGCGMGREAFALSDMGYFVTGIDISDEVIRQVTTCAGQNGYKIPFICYDGHSLPFEDNSFDVVIIWAQTFGLLYGDSYKNEFLRECRRVLTDGGLLSYSAHDFAYETEHYEKYLVGRKFYPYADTELYWETFLPDELKYFAEAAGFSVILCDIGEIYKPEDGTILHCLCKR